MIIYIANKKTNDIKKDVTTTIFSYNKEEIKSFIKDIYKYKEEIIFQYEKDYEILINLDPKDENDNIKISEILKNSYQFSILQFIAELYPLVRTNKKARYIINLLKPKEIFIHLLSRDEIDKHFLKLCFKILENETTFNKYLNFSNNQDLFSFNNTYTQKDYLIELSHFLGAYDKDIDLDNDIYKLGFITDEMIERYIYLRNTINVDLETFNNQHFEEFERYTYTKEEQEFMDSDWLINKELISYIFDDLDPTYTIEEQVAHIYIKMCFILQYNDTYNVDTSYSPKYSKEKQERISPAYPFVICGEFSRIATKIFNQLDSNIEARCIKDEYGAHEYVGILIKDKNIRIDLEGTKRVIKTTIFSDLSRAKLGLQLLGVKYIQDREHIFENAFNEVYKKLLKDKKIQTEDLLAEYKKIIDEPKTEINFIENMNYFLKNMKEKNIRGNDLICTFYMLATNKYFGDIIYSNIGCDFSEERERNVIINVKENYYILRCITGELINTTTRNLNELFEKGTITYENEKHTLQGIGIKK